MDQAKKSKSQSESLSFLESLAVVGVLEQLEGHLHIYTELFSRETNFIESGEHGNLNEKRTSETTTKLPPDLIEHHPLSSVSVLENDKKYESSNAVTIIDKNELLDSSKILEDLQFLSEILSNTKSELNSTNTFTKLQSALEVENDRLNQESILTTRLLSKQKQMITLQKEIVQFEKNSSEKWKEQMCQLNNLKDQLHLAKQQGDVEERFAKVWLTARNEHEKERRQKDEILQTRSRIKFIETQINRDCIAYENVTAWTKLVSAQLQQKIRDWKQKFATDVRDIEKKIELKKKIIENQCERIDSLETSIGERMAELAPWEEEKKQERLDRLEHMRRYYSCRKIQRWWRKFMINHGLYKKKKQKQKPKPKGKIKKNLK